MTRGPDGAVGRRQSLMQYPEDGSAHNSAPPASKAAEFCNRLSNLSIFERFRSEAGMVFQPERLKRLNQIAIRQMQTSPPPPPCARIEPPRTGKPDWIHKRTPSAVLSILRTAATENGLALS